MTVVSMKEEQCHNGAQGAARSFSLPSSEVQPRQSNYQKYTLPEGVVAIDNAPLYQVVALWGWQLQRPFSRDEVARAFGIDERRAGDVMSYIRRARSDVVLSRQYYDRSEKGARQRFLQIMTAPVLDGRPYCGPSTACVPETPGTQKEVDLQALRRWFLHRPNNT